MPLRDILLQIDSYPEPTPPAAIEQSIKFAVALGATLSALTVQVRISVRNNWLADRLLDISSLAQEEEQKSLMAGKAALDLFSQKAAEAHVLGEAVLEKANLYGVGEHVAQRVRTRDLCIVPVADPFDEQRSVAEAVIFESGRPALLFRPGQANLPGAANFDVVLAWDGSRSAARAMADALPLMLKARLVRVVTVINEKAGAEPGAGAAAVQHLKAYGIEAMPEDVDLAGGKVGKVLEDYAVKHRADLLVMGAYGRSRLREFVLGGATEYMLHAPRLPLFLSH